ncbi:metallophosphoesterase family protein [Shimia haliotis]|uniref:Serine/threonine protein phosphatase 1 n=1 Tax=Shimia haliotis TaxID=1280847 RepID=A0A1I4DB12_9RHOB|nr:metallophosphoesterase family protein [Shimia haliotis]SFK90079.1 serine/threonine protein phosphatase 1 [Shimia haliotis]
MNQPIYAIGDIHGHLDLLDDMLARIKADGGADAHIVFLGDYVDRGPESRGVIERLRRGVEAGRNWICLKGNHDRMFEWFMEDTPRHDPHLLVEYSWLHEKLGGVQTLESYGVTVSKQERLSALHERAKTAVPENHVAFLKSLRLFHEQNGLLFVHAGIKPGVPLGEQSENDLVWIRQGFIDDATPHPWLVVHGHTALKKATHFGNRIDLDGGAAFGRPLCAAVFENGQVWQLTPEGRAAMSPNK